MGVNGREFEARVAMELSLVLPGTLNTSPVICSRQRSLLGNTGPSSFWRNSVMVVVPVVQTCARWPHLAQPMAALISLVHLDKVAALTVLRVYFNP